MWAFGKGSDMFRTTVNVPDHGGLQSFKGPVLEPWQRCRVLSPKKAQAKPISGFHQGTVPARIFLSSLGLGLRWPQEKIDDIDGGCEEV